MLPVSLADAKQHLRIASNDLDVEVQAVLDAAVDYCERIIGTSLRVSTVRVDSYSSWPCNPVRFTTQPVYSIGSVYYYTSGDVDTEVSSSNYRLLQSTLAASTLEWDDGFSKPSTSTRSDAVRITYTAGYSAITDVPPSAIHAIKLMLSVFWSDDDPRLIDRYKDAAKSLLAAVDWGSYR